METSKIDETERKRLEDTIHELESTAEELWQLTELPDEARILLSERDGWSINFIFDYLSRFHHGDVRERNSLATRVAAIQLSLTTAGRYRVALQLDQWPPPKQRKRKGKTVMEIEKASKLPGAKSGLQIDQMGSSSQAAIDRIMARYSQRPSSS